MDTFGKVDRFIAVKRSDLRERSDAERALVPGSQPFVTISSQSGAGGHRLAEALVALLATEAEGGEAFRGWHSFDKSMCEHVMEEEHLARSMGELLDEDYHSQIAEFVLGLFGDRGMQNAAYPRLAKVLRTIASVGKVVVLGHGGCLATRELSGGIHVRLVAPLPIRAARMATLLDLDESQAMQGIRKRDDERRRLLKTHYGTDGTDPELYHLVCNTERMSPETVAGLVLSLLRTRLD